MEATILGFLGLGFTEENTFRGTPSAPIIAHINQFPFHFPCESASVHPLYPYAPGGSGDLAFSLRIRTTGATTGFLGAIRILSKSP